MGKRLAACFIFLRHLRKERHQKAIHQATQEFVKKFRQSLKVSTYKSFVKVKSFNLRHGTSTWTQSF
jgi:hypothetical protein